MSKFKNELKFAADGTNPNQGVGRKNSSQVITIQTNPTSQSALRGYAIDDIVKIVKDGSRYKYIYVCVLFCCWHNITISLSLCIY
jgi:hypothetical protein